MLTNIPLAVQHAFLVLISALLAWAAQVIPTVDTLPEAAKYVLGAAIAWLIGYVLPPIDGYGVGKSAPAKVEAV